MTIDHTHQPDASSWVPGAEEHPHFPVQNLPLGVFSQDGGSRRIGCAIGPWILDLSSAAAGGLLEHDLVEALLAEALNPLFDLPADCRRKLRHRLFALLTQQDQRALVEEQLHKAAECELHLPFRVGDYTDFYVGIHHATNVGKLFRPENPLLPNYKYVPIAYHGRASSVRVSGTPVVRPSGQIKCPGTEHPVFAPTGRLDFELELGVWIAGENPLGEQVPVAQAWDRVGGFCLLNDWSARDIQAWEYQPLGPFLSKNFQTSVSPWVVTAEALAPFRIAQPARESGDPSPLPYLSNAEDDRAGALNVSLEVLIASKAMRESAIPAHRLTRSKADNMYWSVSQMIAHHTSNGCDLHPGDLLGSGTISGADADSLGSLLEISDGGKTPVILPSGEERRFLEDDDEITLTALAESSGYRSIGFGTCIGRVESSRR